MVSVLYGMSKIRKLAGYDSPSVNVTCSINLKPYLTSQVMYTFLTPMLPSTYSEVICGGREFRYYVYNIRTIKSTDNTGEI